MDERLISEFLRLGVSSEAAVIATQVFLELNEIKKYWDVGYEYNAALNRIVLRGKKTKRDTISVFVPVSVHEDLCFAKVSDLIDSCGESGIFLAIVHPDSTCVYYRVSEGLIEPTEEEVSAKHLRIDRRELLDSGLRKNRRVLEEAARYGVAVSISNESGSSSNVPSSVDSKK
ncbi:tRNA-splicing endonuclease subunit Sen15-like [Cylas formicarius]|uniref:tRNA-splicing endonuclease subunit Sen15-like n=1 Tax=Cylas formicarius TaxID=197179 RepID=UPI002958786A|nr:tRNA-splicing endonuclease subunit Sen15-like [Cylas formicarius]